MSGVCRILMPRRGSEKLPCPCIWVTATYAFQYEMGPSAVYTSFFTFARPYAGGRTRGVLFPSMLNRGSYLPGPHELYTAFWAGVIAGDNAMIAPTFKSRFGQ